MVRDPVFEREPAKPAIGQVHLNVATQCPLRADREHVADDQHPDHELRINRRPTKLRIERSQLRVYPRQVENAGNPPYRVIAGNSLIKTERIEELLLIMLQPTHHRSPP